MENGRNFLYLVWAWLYVVRIRMQLILPSAAIYDCNSRQANNTVIRFYMTQCRNLKQVQNFKILFMSISRVNAAASIISNSGIKGWHICENGHAYLELNIHSRLIFFSFSYYHLNKKKFIFLFLFCFLFYIKFLWVTKMKKKSYLQRKYFHRSNRICRAREQNTRNVDYRENAEDTGMLNFRLQVFRRPLHTLRDIIQLSIAFCFIVIIFKHPRL